MAAYFGGALERMCPLTLSFEESCSPDYERGMDAYMEECKRLVSIIPVYRVVFY